MNRISSVGAALLAAVLVQSQARDNVAVYGIGSNSCGALVQAYREGSPSVGVEHQGRVFSAKSQLYAQWLAGFFSSSNVFKSETGDFAKGTDMDGLTEWVRFYCEKNPTQSVIRAATECAFAVEKQK